MLQIAIDQIDVRTPNFGKEAEFIFLNILEAEEIPPKTTNEIAVKTPRIEITYPFMFSIFASMSYDFVINSSTLSKLLFRLSLFN